MGLAGAIVGGVTAIGSAVIGSSAAGKAASASQHAADQSAQVQRDIYDSNKAMLTPYTTQGLGATNQINALLGLGGSTAGTPDYAGYLSANPDVQNGFNGLSAQDRSLFPDANAYAQFHYQNYGRNEGRQLATTPGTSGADAANAAFDQFRNSTGYQFRLGQGMNALNSGYAGAGTIKSGAAIKGAVNYGQGMASQEFGNYLNALGTQQGVGLSAGSALAGVGTNYANALGSIYTQNGENQANAALAKANSITGAIGGTVGLAAKYGNLFGGGGGVPGLGWSI